MVRIGNSASSATTPEEEKRQMSVVAMASRANVTSHTLTEMGAVVALVNMEEPPKAWINYCVEIFRG